MRQVWKVSYGEYSDYGVYAVCSSYEQACGVAVKHGMCAEPEPIELWEQEDGMPPFKAVHHCIARRGRDSSRPIDIDHSSEPIAVDAPWPEPELNLSAPENVYRWVNARSHRSAEEAERVAVAAYKSREGLL